MKNICHNIEKKSGLWNTQYLFKVFPQNQFIATSIWTKFIPFEWAIISVTKEQPHSGDFYRPFCKILSSSDVTIKNYCTFFSLQNIGQSLIFVASLVYGLSIFIIQTWRGLSPAKTNLKIMSIVPLPLPLSMEVDFQMLIHYKCLR